MATRFYLQASNVAGIAPVFGGGSGTAWDDTTSADRRMMYAQKFTDTIASKVTATQTAVGNFLNRQFISPPLQAQTISGTVQGQVRGSENNATNDGVEAVKIYVVSQDGLITRGVLLDMTFPALAVNEYTTTITNRNTPVSTAITSITCQDGDRIVVEIGEHKYTATAAFSVTQSFGDSAGTDLAVDQTTTTANNAWVEFSGTLTFQSIAKLQASFAAGALDAMKFGQFTGGSATITFSNKAMNLNLPASATATSDADIFGYDEFDLTGQRFLIGVTSILNVATGADSTFVLAQDGPQTNALQMQVEAGALYAQKIVAGAQTNITNIAYNGTTMRYLAIRETAGTTFWEYSADGKAWTTLTSAANPITVTKLYLQLGATCYQVETNPGTFSIDVINMAPFIGSPMDIQQSINRASTY